MHRGSDTRSRQGRTNPLTAAAGWLRIAVAGLALGALAGCADTLDTHVTRFQAALPAPAGQSFFILPQDPSQRGGIEFGEYAGVLADHLAKLGYRPADNPDSAQLVVHFHYGVDHGRSVVQSSPDPYWGPWRGYAGFGGWGRHGAWGWGWQDPWMGGGIDTYTVYDSGVGMTIDDKATGRRVFEGRAEAASTSDRLPYLVPNLVDAMFTGFPGNSGQTVRITIAPETHSATMH